MSRRRRSAREKAVRLRVARAKVLRRRARTAGRTVTAAMTAAITLAGVGATTASATAAGERTTALKSVSWAAGSPQAGCGDPQDAPSNPYDMTDVAGTVFFAADDGIHGQELWKSDGTASGTVLVKDISPGGSGGGGYYGYGPTDLTAVGGTLFFSADDGKHGRELWKSDGTKAGTVMVKDVNPGGSSGYYYYGPSQLTNVDGTLYFVEDDGTHGEELWKSDGTKAGTVMVKDINPVQEGRYADGPSDLTVLDGVLYFAADDEVHGRELWKSDGTRAGTVMVKNIRSRDYSSNPYYLTVVGKTLFFSATDGVHGDELWKSDGTNAGTVMVKDITPGGGGGGGGYYGGYGPTELTNVGGTLFFSDDDGTHGEELWKSDGTKAGTVLVKDISRGRNNYSYGPSDLTDLDGTLFFSDDNGTTGPELWKSDGTKAGTVMVKNINPGMYGSYPDSLTAVGSTLFFTARDGVHGPELWRSDGTVTGTKLVKDIHPCTRHRPPTNLADIGGTLYFAADDGTHGKELWKSDGSESGTVMVKDINRKPPGQFAPIRKAHRRPAR